MFQEDAVHYWFAIGSAYARELRDDPETSQEYRDYQVMVDDLQGMERKMAKSCSGTGRTGHQKISKGRIAT